MQKSGVLFDAVSSHSVEPVSSLKSGLDSDETKAGFLSEEDEQPTLMWQSVDNWTKPISDDSDSLSTSSPDSVYSLSLLQGGGALHGGETSFPPLHQLMWFCHGLTFGSYILLVKGTVLLVMDEPAVKMEVLDSFNSLHHQSM